MIEVIFVCTGNLFRSISAEYALKNYLDKIEGKTLSVKSCGIKLGATVYNPEVRSALADVISLVSIHHPVDSKVYLNDFSENIVLISMAKEHKDYIFDTYGLKSILFNEIVFKDSSDIKDVWEVISDSLENDESRTFYIGNVVRDINSNIKQVYDYIVNNSKV